jgi:hypothetical protein
MNPLKNLRMTSLNEKNYKYIKEYFVIPEIPELPDYIYKIKLREVPSPRHLSYFEPQVILVDNQTLDRIKNLRPINYQHDDFEFPKEGDVYWINFRTGELVFNNELAGKMVEVRYHGTGSLMSVDAFNNIENRFRTQPIINDYAMTLKNPHEVYDEIPSRVIDGGVISYKDGEGIVFDLEISYKPDSDYPMSVMYDGESINIIGMDNNHVYILWEDKTKHIKKNQIKMNYTFTTGYDNIFCKILDYDTKEDLYIQFLYVKDKNKFYIYDRKNNKLMGSTNPYNLYINQQYNLKVFIDVEKEYELFDGDSVIFKSRVSGHTHDGIDSPRLKGYLNHTAQLERDFAEPTHMDMIKELDFTFLNIKNFNNEKLETIIQQYENGHKKITWKDILFFDTYYPNVLFTWKKYDDYNINNVL